MKNLLHYFGQSPSSDELASSSKENEAGSVPVQEKSGVCKASSSDVLKCKTSGNNLNPEEHSDRSQSDFIEKTVKTKQAGKRKSVAKKKSSASDDEDFNVKSTPKTVKRNYTPRQKKTVKIPPDSELTQPAVESNVASLRTNNPTAGAEQPVTLLEEATVVSTSHVDCASESKLKPAKNILNFFSPTKSIDIQSERSETNDDTTGLQGKSSGSNHEGESLTELKEEKELSKRVSVQKDCKELKQDLVSGQLCDTANKVKKKKVSAKKRGVSEPKSKAAGNEDTAELIPSASQPSKDDIKSCVCNAFQMLMSKKLDLHVSTVSNSDSKVEEGSCSINTEDDASIDYTPKVVLRRKKRNRINSDTEEDDQCGISSQNKKKASEVDETNIQEESGKKSLMNYFSKITKKEAEIQSQKIQFKVEALVHHSDGSPYKSKSKTAASSQQKKLKKNKAKQRNDENEIKWLGSEEIPVEKSLAAEPKAVGSPELDQKEEDKCQEGETKSAEGSSVPRAKRSLKLTFSDSEPSKVKRLKKASASSGKETSSADSSEASLKQSGSSGANISPITAEERTESSPPLVTKAPGKKLKQVSLMDQFVRKPCNDATPSKDSETTKDWNEFSSQISPFVKLEKISSSALDTKEKTPLKSKQKKSFSKSKRSESTTQVVSGEKDAMKQLPEEPSVESTLSPYQSTSDGNTPNVRTWKMRVCLTPKPEASHTNSPVVSPITVDTDSEDDFDVQEIAVVKNKKKKKVKPTVLVSKEAADKEVEIVYDEKVSSNISKAPAKLAPLFVRPKKPDPIAEQAKLEFLQSGVPEQIKKIVEVQKSMECTEVVLFPLISHVTQLEKDLPWTPSESQLTWTTESPESNPEPSESLRMGDMTTCDPLGCEMAEVVSNCSTSLHRIKRRIALEHVPSILSLIRAEDSSFEVIQNFKTLREKYRKVLDPEGSAALASKLDSKSRKRSRSTRKSRGSNQGMNSPKPIRNISNLMWTDKYCPTTSGAIVGNGMSVHSLKHWLESLRKISQSGQGPVSKTAKRTKKNDYEDDFVVSDDNCDSNCSSTFLSNSALLIGCHGSGKTNCVYALAADLGYKVLEINGSERRSGKIILAKLSEATQSHQVANRSQEQNPAAAKLFNPKNPKSKASKRKIEKQQETGEESTKNKLSLILIKDIDVVFEEEDEGFVSAVASLVSTSKRPVIFTTTDGNCLNVRRIINSSTKLFEFIPNKMALCSWLQTIALVEGAYVSRSAIEDLLSTCREDVRQCLLQLQVWMSTGGNHLLESTVTRDDSFQVQEETRVEEFLLADISEGDLNGDVDRSSLTIYEHHDCIGALQGRNDVELGKEVNRVSIPSHVPFGRVWWNVPLLLSLPQVQVPKLVLPEALEQPRRFRGLFDDSIFDVTSDDEDLPNSIPLNSQRTSSQSTDPQPMDSQPMDSQPTDSQPAVSQPTDFQLGSSQPTVSAGENVPTVENVAESVENTQASDAEQCSQEELDAMLSHLQAMSTCDLISTATNLQENADDFEPTPRYWRTSPRDSLSLSTPMMEGPNILVENISRSMCHWLAESSIEHARTVLHVDSQPRRFNALLPDHQIERRRLTVADAERTVLRIVATCAQLERSAIALDYLPTLRRISSLEQRRAETNTSRRNRFYHYFKSLSMDITQEQTKILSST